jgi:hypothetical protein
MAHVRTLSVMPRHLLTSRSIRTLLARVAAVLATGLAIGAGAMLMASQAGCALAGFAAVAAKEARKNKTQKVEAEYKGLAGHTFAVIAAADRFTQADHPELVGTVMAEVTDRLREGTPHTGHIPADRMLRYLYDHPRWVAMPRARLAGELGVDCLVWIDILDYRLHEPGNIYEWDGVAAATVGVIDSSSPDPDEFVFEKTVRVAFPDKTNAGTEEWTRELITRRLMQRLIDRASWPLYDHMEKIELEY